MLFIFALLVACNSSNVQEIEHYKSEVNRDLDSIQSKGKLKVLMEYTPTNYFIYKGNI